MKSNNSQKKYLLLVGVAAGFLALIFATLLRPSPPLSETFNRAVLVDTVALAKQDVSAVIAGFGRVEPKTTWQALAEVSGKVIYRNPQLEQGRVLLKGTRLLAIDPLEYQLKLDQSRENLNATRARLVRLDQEEKNLNSSLLLEQQKLTITEQEFKRKKQLNEQKLIADAVLDTEKKAQLAQRKLVQDLESQLKLVPDDRKVTQAQLRVDEATLKDAERRLAQTEILLPFTARIGKVDVELNQVVNQGSVMLVAQNLGHVEIKAEFSLKDLRNLVKNSNRSLRPGEVPSIEHFQFSGKVKLQIADIYREWPASVTRIAETVNPDQASIGVYLEVEEDLRTFNPAIRPPLTKGMLVTAFIGSPTGQQFVIPEKALHENRVYLMSEDNKLRIVPVKVLFRTESGVAIKGDIHTGDQLILNDLIPAIAGMSLRVEPGE